MIARRNKMKPVGLLLKTTKCVPLVTKGGDEFFLFKTLLKPTLSVRFCVSLVVLLQK